MIDTLCACRSRIEASSILEKLSLKRWNYALLTLHRPSNVDDPQILETLRTAISRIQERVTVVFPVHPRTKKSLESSGWGDLPNLQMIDPLGYFDFIRLESCARFVLTDSGGVQEETTALRVPCFTMRDNTERPITIERGSNTLVGRDPERILQAVVRLLASERQEPPAPDLWDGRAAQRILDVLAAAFMTDRRSNE
jgi:UDP-N-acetylglucosamine 2-epimerase (non-hydrolysing)